MQDPTCHLHRASAGDAPAAAGSGSPAAGNSTPNCAIAGLAAAELTEGRRKEIALLNLMEDLAESNARLETANRDLHRQSEEIQHLNTTLERRVIERTEQLQESQERVELALQVAHAFAFEWNVATDEVRRSLHCAEILGLSGDATRDTGATFFQRVHPEDRDMFVRLVTGLTPKHPHYSVEYRVVGPDSQTVVLQESATGTFDAQNRLVRVIGMTADVTARVKAEQAIVRLNQALRRRMIELQTIFDNAPVGLSISDDPTCAHVRGNAALEAMLEAPTGSELSLEAGVASFRATRNGHDIPITELPMQRAGRGEVVAGDNLDIVRPDGTTVSLLSNAAPLYDEAGRPYGVIGVFLDVTASKRAEAALRMSELRFRTIYDTAPVSIWRQDWSDIIAELQRLRAGGIADFGAYIQSHPEFVAWALGAVKIIDVNQRTLEMFGAREKAELRTLRTVYATPEAVAGFAEKLIAVAAGQTVHRGEMPLTTIGGGRLHGMLAISFPPPNSDTAEVLVSVVDITQRKHTELELHTVAAELKTANQELESFAYSISHDLRAPLRSIDGFSRILLRDCQDQLDPKHRDNLDRVRQSSQRMGELIDDLLELSRATRANLRRTSVDLSATALALFEDLHHAEPARTVTWRVEPGLVTEGDPVLLRAALNNLLSNAWKFTQRTPHARIEVGAADRDGERVFFVRDNGVGFDLTYASKLFGAFQRFHPASEFPGTGIGLATVQRIIHRHGGRIWADAAVDAGATFYFTVGSTPPPS